MTTRRPAPKSERARWTEGEQEEFEERAAIMEYMGGLSKLEAEVLASRRISEKRERWNR